MANSFSLSTAGAMPTVSSNLSKPYSGPAITVGQLPSKQVNQTGLTNDGTNIPVKLPTTTVPLTSGMLPSSAPKATTPLASTTITDPAGNTVKHTYQNNTSSSASTPSYSGPSYAGLVGTDTRVTPNTTPPAQPVNVSAGTNQPVNPSATSNANTVPIDPATNQPYANNTTTLQSAANAVNAARQPTADESYYNNMAVTGKELQNINTLSPYAESQLYGGTGQQLAPDEAAPDLQGRAAGTNALAGSLGNIFGSAAQTGETNAIAQQQQNLGGAEALLGSAAPVTQAGMLTNPYTGQPLNPSLVSNAVQQASQLVSNGTPITDPTVQALLSPFGFYGTSALVQAQQTLSGGNFNPANQSAAGQANAQNIGTAGTANTQVAASGYASTLPVYQQASTDFTTADQQAGNLLNTLKETGINSTNATDYNTTINGLASKLGSTQTTAFTTALTEAQQAYTKLLSSVGAATPTVNGEAATSVLNPSSTPAQIAESIDKLNEAAYAKLAPQYQQALNYYNQLHGTNETAIPGYPAPVQPTPVSSTTPQGPDTSSGNLEKAGAGGLVQGAEGITNGVLGFIEKI